MQIVTLVVADTWYGSKSTGEALWFSLALTLGLWVLVGVPAYLLHRRWKRRGSPPVENFYAEAAKRDTVERRVLVSSAAWTLGLLLPFGYAYNLLALVSGWPQPDLTETLMAAQLVFSIIFSVFYQRHRR